MAGGQAGGAGGGGQYFAEYFQVEEEEVDKTTLAAQAEQRRADLIALIQNTVEPDSWYEAGGKGTVTSYQNKKLIIRQTREIHNKVEQLLKDMRKSLGHQIAIEARFLIVGENFLEDIGLDVDFTYNAGGKWGLIGVEQSSSDAVVPKATQVAGTLGSSDTGTPVITGAKITGGYGTPLDDLQVAFLLRASQEHKDTKSLTAPRVTVLSGESATMRVQNTIRYALPPDISYGGYGGTAGAGAGYGGYGGGMSSMQQSYNEILTGTVLNITPIITPDKKHVLLNIVTEMRSLIDWKETKVEVPLGSGIEPAHYTITLPQTEISRIMTRVSMPDGATLLLGGQKITEEVETEAGVPILSKVPILGRAFSNRSKIKDHKILLILVKPTIILQEEVDAEAIAAAEGGS